MVLVQGDLPPHCVPRRCAPALLLQGLQLGIILKPRGGVTSFILTRHSGYQAKLALASVRMRCRFLCAPLSRETIVAEG